MIFYFLGGPVGILPEEKNLIGSVITEIFRDGQLDGQTSFYFVYLLILYQVLYLSLQNHKNELEICRSR